MTATASRPVEPVGEQPGPGPRRPTRVAAIAVGIVVALLVVLLATRDQRGDSTAQADLVGQRAPALNGEVLLGEGFDLGASDRWTVVNFFATWCVPCIQEHPELRAFNEEHVALDDAQVVSVVYDDKPSVVTRFFEENGGDWSVLDADEGRTALDWGVAKVPESYIVSPTGIIVERLVGGVTQANLNQVIAAYDAPVPAASEDGS